MLDNSKGIKAFFQKAVACWALDGTTGGLVDQSGNNNNLTLKGGVIESPIISTNAGNSGYLYKNNILDFVEGPTTAILSGITSFTVIAWISTLGTTGTTQNILTKLRIAGSEKFSLSIDTNLAPVIRIVQVGGAGVSTISTTRIIVNTRNLVIGTFNAATFTRSIYLNGNLENRAVGALGIIAGGSLLKIGQRDANLPFNGTIGQCGVLNYAITAQQVSDYYNYETEPVRKYWDFADVHATRRHQKVTNKSLVTI